MELTKNEIYILNAIRSLEPFEFIQITADAMGKPDSFLIHRSTKVVLTIEKNPQNVRSVLKSDL